MVTESFKYECSSKQCWFCISQISYCIPARGKTLLNCYYINNVYVFTALGYKIKRLRPLATDIYSSVCPEGPKLFLPKEFIWKNRNDESAGEIRATDRNKCVDARRQLTKRIMGACTIMIIMKTSCDAGKLPEMPHDNYLELA